MNALLLALSFLFISCTTNLGDNHYRLIKNSYYTSAKEERQMGEVYIPTGQGPFPGVVLVHGGGWNSRSLSDMNSVAQSLASHGFVVYNINYRLAPKHLHPAPIIDLENALIFFKNHAKEYNLNPKRIGLWGYSSGGHITSYYALIHAKDKERKVQAVVAGGTPFDFTWYPNSPIFNKYMGGHRDKMLTQYFDASPAFKISSEAPPFYLYHAEEDKLIEFAQSTSFEAKLRAANVPVERHDIGWWGHATAFVFSEEAVVEGINFLKKKL